MIESKWTHNVDSFIELANKHDLKMLMVGGGAENFHGYQRHSADVDFWIDTSAVNLNKLVRILNEMGFEIEDLPQDVKE